MKKLKMKKLDYLIASIYGGLWEDTPISTHLLLVDWTRDRAFWQAVAWQSRGALMCQGEERTSLSLNYEQELCASL